MTGDRPPLQQPTPTQRAIFGLVVGAVTLCIPLVTLARPVALGAAVQSGLLLVLATLYWRWLRGSVVVPLVAVLPFAAAVVATVLALR